MVQIKMTFLTSSLDPAVSRGERQACQRGARKQIDSAVAFWKAAATASVICKRGKGCAVCAADPDRTHTLGPHNGAKLSGEPVPVAGQRAACVCVQEQASRSSRGRPGHQEAAAGSAAADAGEALGKRDAGATPSIPPSKRNTITTRFSV